jgi:serine/threonine-protein kinase
VIASAAAQAPSVGRQRIASAAPQAQSVGRQRIVPAVAPEPPRRPMQSSPPPPPAGRPSVPPPFEDTHPPQHTLIGQVLGGKFRAVRVLGEGGMGSVYECEHLALGRRVAVKVLHPAQARKKASVQRFHHEAHVAGAIGHPNICEIYDVGELEDGSPFLVMELLQGETLADRIASEGALAFDDIIEIVTQMLSGLVAAHEKGIIHRDIKPENVFLTQRTGLAPLVKLLDFGISKVAGADDLNLTRTGMVMGTPFYMSPEQARGDRNLDRRVDLYATGVVTYECLTGRRPFNAANYNALLVQILTTSPRPPSEIRPAIPDGFEPVVSRAMQRDREKRYQTAAEFQRELAGLREPAPLRRPMPASIPPEPVPLVTPRFRKDAETGVAPVSAGRAPPSSKPSSRDEELPAISLDIEGRDLLDSSVHPVADGSPASVEIPIVADAPMTSRESAREADRGAPRSAPRSAPRGDVRAAAPPEVRAPEPRPSVGPPRPAPRPSVGPPPLPRASAPSPRPAVKEPAWKPPPMPTRAASTPSVAQPPSIPPPRSERGPASTPKPRQPSVPPNAPTTEPDAPNAPAVLGNALGRAIASSPGARLVANGPERPKGRVPERFNTPTPTPVDFSKMFPEAPYLDEQDDEDSDPTQVGTLLDPATLGVSGRRFDPDATDRIELTPAAMAAAARQLDDRNRARGERADREAREAELRGAEDPHETTVEQDPDDEAPTTLFDRKELRRRAKSQPKGTPRATTTERAPPPLPGGMGRAPSLAPGPDARIPQAPNLPRAPRRGDG